MRDLGGISVDDLEAAGEVNFYYFVRLVFPEPTGTLRFSNYPNRSGAADDIYTTDVDGAMHDWRLDRLYKVGQMTYGQDPSTIQSLSFLNVDDYFTDIGNLHGGFKGTPVTVWRVHYDKSTRLPQGGVRIFNGVLSATSIGDLFECSTFRPRFASQFPARRITTVLFPFLPPPGTKIDWGAITRGPEPSPPERRSTDTVPPADWVPPPGDSDSGRLPVILSDRGGRVPRTIGAR